MSELLEPKEVLDRTMGTYRRAAPLFASGEGAWVTDGDGKRYLDLISGIGAACAIRFASRATEGDSHVCVCDLPLSVRDGGAIVRQHLHAIKQIGVRFALLREQLGEVLGVGELEAMRHR